MSWENEVCPCGGRKARETMLCERCREALADTYEMAVFSDETADHGQRRAAAIRLLSMARRRKQEAHR